LQPHSRQIPIEDLKALIRTAIETANKKSSREILSIPANATMDELDQIYERKGRELFKYFKKYVGDPASSAHQIYGKHYRVVGMEQFRNRTLQKERMNSGWRYQYLCNSIRKIGGVRVSTSDIISLMLDELFLLDSPNKLLDEIDIPDEVLDVFRKHCYEAGLINEAGIFHDPYRLLHFFCQFA
jgi:hypothetical protein